MHNCSKRINEGFEMEHGSAEGLQSMERTIECLWSYTGRFNATLLYTVR
jgi:hypothetical protein